jgi:para-aminobenzoate synthetase component 1
MSFYSQPLDYRSDSTAYYAAIAGLPWAVWLDSARAGRYDILTAAPYRTVELRRGDVANDPFARLRSVLGHTVEPVPDVPFAGGLLGYWGYDLALPDAPVSGALPDVMLGLYDWAVVIDHTQQTARLVSHQRDAATTALLPSLLERLRVGQALPMDDFRVSGSVAFNFTPERYAQAFAAVQAYLRAGDCYQVNLAQRFCAHAQGNALGAYIRLRQMSRAPYSAFLNFPHAQILCTSPERFLRVHDGSVETKPIKGTRPRGTDSAEDRLLIEDLRHHPKDRAENLMIVDLLRSDLGKNCLPGSVRTTALFEVESFANVHHLVSTITGQIAPGHDALDVLRDCFPGGSITGAPKQRAMQIINELEPNRREVYCGAIGYVGFDGNMDTNIPIRTLVYSGNQIRGWAGGGIVADSDGAREYQETFDKASVMLALLRQYGGAD